jgi:hypothetical protein
VFTMKKTITFDTQVWSVQVRVISLNCFQWMGKRSYICWLLELFCICCVNYREFYHLSWNDSLNFCLIAVTNENKSCILISIVFFFFCFCKRTFLYANHNNFRRECFLVLVYLCEIRHKNHCNRDKLILICLWLA